MDNNTKLLIASGPEHAATYLFTDSFNPAELFVECALVMKNVEELLERSPFAGRPLFEMIKEITYKQKGDLEPVKTDHDTFHEHCLELLEMGSKAVRDHYGEEDYKLYGQFIVTATEEAAKASGGGWLGLDAEYTGEEKQHVQKLKDMFGLN